MKKKWLSFVILLLASITSAVAQTSVKQSGTVTPHHPVMWTTNGVVQDAGVAVNGFLTGVGVVAQGPGFCQNDAPITTPYHRICLGIDAGSGFLSFGSFGGASALPFELNINGQIINPVTGQFTQLSITRAQIPTVTVGAAYIVLTGYRSAGDLGAGAVYTSNGATSTGLEAIRDGSGQWYNLVVGNTVNTGWFGAYADGSTHAITAGDISANPQWRGTYVAGTSWDTVAVQEASYAAWAGASTPGSIVWNGLNNGDGISLNKDFFVSCNANNAGGIQGSSYIINKPLLAEMSQFRVDFCSATNFVWTGDPTVSMWTWNAASYGLIERMHLSFDPSGITPSPDYNTAAPLLTLNYTAAIPGLATQNLYFENIVIGVGTNGRGLAISPAGSGAQGSTISFVNAQIIGFQSDYGISVQGGNAFNIDFFNFDCQGIAHDCIQQTAGGTVNLYGGSFENEDLSAGNYTPVPSQFLSYGADVHLYTSCCGTNPSAVKDVRSESDVAVLCEAIGPGCTVNNYTVAQSSSGLWQANHVYLQGNTIFSNFLDGGSPTSVGSKFHTFMMVDDGGNRAWNAPTAGSTTLVIQDSTASYTVNQWTGFTLLFRYPTGLTEQHTIASNTATSITLNTPTAQVPTGSNLYRIAGKSGSSPPTWDSSPTGYASTDYNFITTGISTVSGSNVVVMTEATAGTPAIHTNDYVVIPNADCLGSGPIFPAALIAKVTAVNSPIAGDVTINKNACYTLNDTFASWGGPITDGDLTWIDFQFYTFRGNSAPGGMSADNIVSNGGRSFRIGNAKNFGNVRFDWQQLTTSYGQTLSPSAPSTNVAATQNFNSLNQINGFVQRASIAITPAATIDLTNYLYSTDFLTLTPAGNETINAPSEISTSMVRAWTLFITTSGVTPRTLTWGTNFCTNQPSTYVTSATSGFTSELEFVWNGSCWQQRAVLALTANTSNTFGFSAGQLLYSDGTLLQATTGVTWPTSGELRLTTGLQFGASADPKLFRQSSNELGITNGTNATAFRVFNTTDSDAAPVNYEAGTFDFTSNTNILTIGTIKAGSGSARALEFVSGGVDEMDFGVTFANLWIIQPGNSQAALYFNNNSKFIQSDSGNAFLFENITTGGQISEVADRFLMIGQSATATSVQLTEGSEFCFTNNTSATFLGSCHDLGFARNTAGVLEINSGTIGTLRDITLRNFTASGSITNTGITADTGHTDATVCEDTTSHQFYSGTGAAGICLGTSSLRFKHDVADLDVGLDQVIALQPIRYKLNSDHSSEPDKVLYGFSAEQGGTVLPQLMGLDQNGRPNTFDYMGVVPVLVRAIQQQQAEIEALKHANDNGDSLAIAN